MSFETPWLWLLLPPILAFLIWLGRRSYTQLSRRGLVLSLGLRLAIVALVIAALSRPAMEISSRSRHLVLALDVSRSVSADNVAAAMASADAMAKEAFDTAGNLRVSVIAFGDRPALVINGADSWKGWPEDLKEKLTYESTLTRLYAERTRVSGAAGADAGKNAATLDAKIAAIEGFRDSIAGEHTDVESALRLALNGGAAGERKTIYLFTDANANRGAWLQGLPAGEMDDAALHVVLLDRPFPPEVAVVGVDVPQRVRVNQAFAVNVMIAATEPTTAQLAVYRDGFLISERDVSLAAGQNRFDLPGMFFREKGFRYVEAVIRAKNDTRVENNIKRTTVVVPGAARVLFVDSDERQMSYLKTALELEGIDVEARPSTGVPDSMADLLDFDAFVLSNVPADRLSQRQMRMIRSYVEDFGGGFLMLGGDESFGLGGYFDTPVEDILPVRMPIQKDLNRPSLGLMFVIDKSGSMEGAKIELAKRAAIATAEAIHPRDQIGLVAFDGASRVILELTPASDRGTIRNHIGTLSAGGGTFLYPALQDAHDRLINSGARKKHIIVLSDGQTQGFGYEDYVSQMGADGITLSAVGIGEGADMRLMEAIAQAGAGRAYFTNDVHSIPQIFTREALRASKSMLVERIVEPVFVSDDVAFREIDTEALPLLSGYVATTPRANARLVLASDTGDPLLARWRFGLGRTAAFTSDAKTRWAEDWIEWEDFAKFWSQLIRSLTGEELARGVSIESSRELRRDQEIVRADIRTSGGEFVDRAEVSLAATDAAGNSTDVPVRQVGPGVYEAAPQPVIYNEDRHFVWRVRTSDGAELTKPYGWNTRYSPEFDQLSPDREMADAIASRTKGSVTSVGQTKLALFEAPIRIRRELWPTLLMIGLLLVPVDIFVRRVL
ncbi:MAG TPA: VWA domain-containing protein [Phycisphaerae bacterium]|nr:VWA domain-containing protein [Phycisphaerae bacterium]HRW53000.1 VWA domain-containing protein [Phycisphaerae bacterium]